MAKISIQKEINPQFAVILGTIFFLICGISVSILASTTLSADDYVNFIAFVSLSGIVVLGLGSALEQESTLVQLRLQQSGIQAWKYMSWRIGFATIGIWLLFLLPIYSWQQRLFGNVTSQVQIAVVVGAPGLLITTVARGFVNGEGNFRQLSRAHVVFGASTLLVPLTLYASGLTLIHGLIFGQVIAWSMPLLILLRRGKQKDNTTETKALRLPNLTIWLMASNFLLLANLNSTNLILRSRTNIISSSVIAESQLLVTVSCLASALTLGLLPFLIGKNKRKTQTETNSWEKYLNASLIIFALIFVAGISVFRKLVVALLLPRSSQIELLDALFITFPALFWTVSLTLSAKLIAQERVRRNLLCWLTGLAALWLLPILVTIESLRSLVLTLTIASIISPAIFALSMLHLRYLKPPDTSSYNKLGSRQALILDTLATVPRTIGQALSQRKKSDETVNLVVPHMQSTGIGYFGGIMQHVIESSGIKVNKLYFEPDQSKFEYSRSLSKKTVTVLSPGHLPFAQILHPKCFINCDYRSALIFWDVNKIPKRFGLGFHLLDELWAPSTYVAQTLQEHTKLPVRIFSSPITPLAGGTKGNLRERYKIGDDFLFAYQFDFGSSAQRKNPWAAAEAYRIAFPRENEGARLILKSSRANQESADWQRLERLCSDRRDILLINEYWDEEVVADLYLDIDCYISTHRSEGYGLTLSHALAAGKYVIATNFGGVTDFLNKDYSGLIPYELVQVGDNNIYPVDALWAQPSIGVAAELMREAFDNSSRTRSLGIAAGQLAREEFTIEKSMAQVSQLLSLSKLKLS